MFSKVPVFPLELRPVSTARTSISRHQSPMLLNSKFKPNSTLAQPPSFNRSKTQHDSLGGAAVFNLGASGNSCDPFKQYASVDLRTLTQWNEYEKRFEAENEQQAKKKEEKEDRERYRRWLKVATNASRPNANQMSS